MRPVQNRQDLMNGAMKVAKRIAITILICVPFLVIFSYLTRDFITTSTVRVICFMAIMGVAVLVEEIIVRKREKKKAEQEIEKKDVFR